MAKTRKLPIVDDADVQRIADLFLTIPNPAVSDEDLVKHADEAALACAYAWGNTVAWRRELVRRVRDRVQFALMARRRSQPSK